MTPPTQHVDHKDAQPLISVDVVPFFYDRASQTLGVVLGDRLNEPFKGEAALPGVLLTHERVAEAAKRALATKVDARGKGGPSFLGEVGVFDNPDRDPRGPTLSIARMAVLPKVSTRNGVHFVPLPTADDLPFEHASIITAACRVAARLTWADPAFLRSLLPDTLSTRDLMVVLRTLSHQGGLDVSLNPANVQRRLRDSGWVVRAEDVRPTASEGRPPVVWRWLEP